jgi:shikimate kinase
VREAAVLDELSRLDAVLISTGGGAVIREDNRQVMHERGAVVYLHTSVNEQARRTGRDRKRPLLQGRDPAQVLAELMAVREPLYRQVAHIVVSTDNRGPKAVAHDLAQQLRTLDPTA